MSSTVSGLSPITTYLSIVKNEAKQAALMVKTDPATQRAVSGFLADTVNISSPTDLLGSKNHSALQVVLGAYNMSGMSTETGLLKKLLTQDPSATGSLVKSLGSTNYLNFVSAMSNRTMVSMDFGDSTANSFVTSGAAASSISFNNLGWGTANASLTAAVPAESWSYVLNDGTAAASIAAALTTAVQSVGTAADPVTSSYTVDAGGAIVGSSDAPAIGTTTDSAGNTVYSLALATSSTGAPIRIANVISVAAPAPASSTTTPMTAAAATSLLSRALTAYGFNIAATGTSGLNLINPITNSVLSVAPRAYTSYAGTTAREITTSTAMLSLGSAASNLTVGQTLLSGASEIGTIKSIDPVGNVTLTASSLVAVAANAVISVAMGVGVSNIGTQITTTGATTTVDSMLALGAPAKGVRAGQIITDGSNVVGIVKSVDNYGNVTLQANSAVAIAAGDTLSVLPQVSNQKIPALLDTSDTAAIYSQYEINQYEAAEGKLIPGMDSALYFTRKMPAITSINALMSDATLLKVVTTNMGISANYGVLPFDAQVALLTKKVKLSDFNTPAKLQAYAERYLVNTALNASSANAIDPNLVILQGGPSASSTDLMSALYPSSGKSTDSLLNMLSSLYA